MVRRAGAIAGGAAWSRIAPARHGSVYEALARGRISSDRLRHLLAGLSAPARAGEPLMFAIDITRWRAPTPSTPMSGPWCRCAARAGTAGCPAGPTACSSASSGAPPPGSIPIQAPRRLWPGEEHTDVTISQITGLLKDLTATGKQQPGDPPLVLLDAGNYATDLTHALAGHDVQLLVRLRSHPGLLPRPRTPATGPDGRATAPRRGVLLLRPRQAAHPRLRTHRGVRAVRHRHRPGLDRAAPKARQHRPLGQLAAGQAAADRARHRAAGRRRPAARRPQATQGPVAVARRPRPGRPRPALEGLPAPLWAKNTSTASPSPISAWPAHT